MWREDLAKDCKQITTFITSETSNNSRVSLRLVPGNWHSLSRFAGYGSMGA